MLKVWFIHGHHLQQGSRVVGVEARPRSIKHGSISELDCGASAQPLEFVASKENPLSVVYTYSVIFKASGACSGRDAMCNV